LSVGNLCSFDDDDVDVLLTTVLLCVFFGLDEVEEGVWMFYIEKEASVWVRPKTGTDNNGDGNGGCLRWYHHNISVYSRRVF